MLHLDFDRLAYPPGLALVNFPRPGELTIELQKS